MKKNSPKRDQIFFIITIVVAIAIILSVWIVPLFVSKFGALFPQSFFILGSLSNDVAKILELSTGQIIQSPAWDYLNFVDVADVYIYYLDMKDRTKYMNQDLLDEKTKEILSIGTELEKKFNDPQFITKYRTILYSAMNASKFNKLSIMKSLLDDPEQFKLFETVDKDGNQVPVDSSTKTYLKLAATTGGSMVIRNALATTAGKLAVQQAVTTIGKGAVASLGQTGGQMVVSNLASVSRAILKQAVSSAATEFTASMAATTEVLAAEIGTEAAASAAAEAVGVSASMAGEAGASFLIQMATFSTGIGIVLVAASVADMIADIVFKYCPCDHPRREGNACRNLKFEMCSGILKATLHKIGTAFPN